MRQNETDLNHSVRVVTANGQIKTSEQEVISDVSYEQAMEQFNREIDSCTRMCNENPSLRFSITLVKNNFYNMPNYVVLRGPIYIYDRKAHKK